MAALVRRAPRSSRCRPATQASGSVSTRRPEAVIGASSPASITMAASACSAPTFSAISGMVVVGERRTPSTISSSTPSGGQRGGIARGRSGRRGSPGPASHPPLRIGRARVSIPVSPANGGGDPRPGCARTRMLTAPDAAPSTSPSTPRDSCSPADAPPRRRLPHPRDDDHRVRPGCGLPRSSAWPRSTRPAARRRPWATRRRARRRAAGRPHRGLPPRQLARASTSVPLAPRAGADHHQWHAGHPAGRSGGRARADRLAGLPRPGGRGRAGAGRGGELAVRCAGVEGEAALDDIYVAGRIVIRAAEGANGAFLTDGARTARAVAQAYAAPLAALLDSQSARELDGTGLESDIARCARESTLDVAPRVVEVAPGRVVVAA